MIPTTRQEFKDWCMRKVGFNVIEINISEEQLDDRVDEALLYFNRYHFDGNQKQYYKYQITDADKVNKYITLPDNIFGVVKIFDINSIQGSNSLFSANFQVAINDLFSIGGFDLVPYYATMQNLSLIQEVLVGMSPIRYNAVTNLLYLDINWDDVLSGSYLMVECYSVIDPANYPRIWEEEWILNYTVALIKEQWGSNLKKYKGMQMPGGVSFSGQEIYDEAKQDLITLKQELITTYSAPVAYFLG